MTVNAEGIATAIIIAIIFAFVKLFRDVGDLKIAVKPVVDWYIKTSMDALKIATNPTSERLAELADKYIAGVQGRRHPKGEITIAEKQELIDGLRAIMRDPQQTTKRLSASISLRFIEQREGLTGSRINNH